MTPAPPKKKGPGMQIEHWPIDRPIPYPRNPRAIPDRAIDKVAASIDEFGWRQPIVVDGKGVVIVGHARLLAAQKLGLAEVPVHIADDLTAAQAKAYRIADNRLNQDSAWNDELLGLELGDLEGLNFDLSLTGFDPAELNALVSPTGGHTDEDEAPAATDTPTSQIGDVWCLGGHRLLCGNATNVEAVSEVLGEPMPNLMVTDPPYGVEYDPDWRNRAKRPDGTPYGASAIGQVSNDDRADWREAWALFAGDVAYVWHAGRHASQVQASLEAASFVIRSQIIWAKPRHIISRGNYHWQHEPCWYAVRKGGKGWWFGGRKQTTLWPVEHMASETGHSAQKPVECMRRPIQNHTRKGEAVYDPFVGSGTTIIAAETIGRICYAIDIDPIYVDVAVKRWQDFTGEVAILEDNGQTFEQTHDARAA